MSAGAYVQPQILGYWLHVGPTGQETLLRFSLLQKVRGEPMIGRMIRHVVGIATSSVEFRCEPHRDYWSLDVRPDDSWRWIPTPYVIDGDRLIVDPGTALAVVYVRRDVLAEVEGALL